MKIKDVRDVLKAAGRESAGEVLKSFPVHDLLPIGAASCSQVAAAFVADVGKVGADQWRSVSKLKPGGSLGGDGVELLRFITDGATVPLVHVSLNGCSGGECLPAMQWRERLATAPAQSVGGAWAAINPFITDGKTVLHHRLVLLKGGGGVPVDLQSRALWRLRELGLSLGAVMHDGADSLHALAVLDAASLVDYKSTARRLLGCLGALGFDREQVTPESLTVLPGARRGEVMASLWFLDSKAAVVSETTFYTVEAAVKAASVPPPAAVDAVPSVDAHALTAEAFDTPANDVGNAALFVRRWCHLLRYVPQLKTWLVLSDGTWRRDQIGSVVEMAKAVADELLKLSATLKGEAQKAAVGRALRMGEAGRITKMIDLAQSDTMLAVEVSSLDASPYLVGVGNGVLDLTAGELLDDSEAMTAMVTKRLGCDFNPAAKCPIWERFIRETTGGDGGLIRFLQQSAGYSLTGEMVEQCFWFLYGSGANGKSVFSETLDALAGSYAARADDSILVASPNAKPGPSLARLPGVRLLLGRETAEGQRLNENVVKDLTGGDTITAEAKYGAPFDFQPVCKLWMYGNHKPAIRGTDQGIWRRVRLVPFTVTVPAEKRDGKLCDKLRSELPGILNWAMHGLNDWASNGRKLAVPECVKAAGDEYRSDSDWLGDFITDRLEKLAGFTVSKREVYRAYEQWAKDEGLSHPLPNKSFSRRLKERGYEESNAKTWRDVRLYTD